jgi:preprotein translocase subunit SecF
MGSKSTSKSKNTAQPDSSSNEVSSKQPFQIVEKAPLWFSISGTLILLSLLAIFMSFQKYNAPVKLGLDFIGGTKIEYKFDKKSDQLTTGSVTEKILKPLGEKFATESIAQIADKQVLILRTVELTVDQRDKLDAGLKKNFGKFTVLSVDTVSGTIGPELLRSGLIALGVTLLGILMFVSYRFRRDFAMCAIVALCHDVIIVVGLFAILGLTLNLEVNILFLTACLTVLGFSIHDTIVVFDRIRENLKFVSKKRSLVQIINESIVQVWFRSVCTSLTVLITLGCLLFFGGETTKIFAGAMFAGILTGTYSSIFVASTLLGQISLLTEKKK